MTKWHWIVLAVSAVQITIGVIGWSFSNGNPIAVLNAVLYLSLGGAGVVVVAFPVLWFLASIGHGMVVALCAFWIFGCCFAVFTGKPPLPDLGLLFLVSSVTAAMSVTSMVGMRRVWQLKQPRKLSEAR